MTKLGKRLIKSAKEARAMVTPSCGCVFCDIGLKPTKMKRQYIHYIRKEGRIVVCDITGVKPT